VDLARATQVVRGAIVHAAVVHHVPVAAIVAERRIAAVTPALLLLL